MTFLHWIERSNLAVNSLREGNVRHIIYGVMSILLLGITVVVKATVKATDIQTYVGAVFNSDIIFVP